MFRHLELHCPFTVRSAQPGRADAVIAASSPSNRTWSWVAPAVWGPVCVPLVPMTLIHLIVEVTSIRSPPPTYSPIQMTPCSGARHQPNRFSLASQDNRWIKGSPSATSSPQLSPRSECVTAYDTLTPQYKLQNPRGAPQTRQPPNIFSSAILY